MTPCRFAVLPVLAMLCGCAWYPSTYFAPDADAGELYATGICGFGPNGGIRIEQDWGTATMALSKNEYAGPPANDHGLQRGEDYLHLHVAFSVNDGAEISLPAPGIKIAIDGGEPRQYRFLQLYSAEWKEREPGGIYFDKIVTDVVFDESRGYIMAEDVFVGSIWIDVDDADTARIDAFELYSGEDKHVVGPITFAKKIGVKFFTINC